MKRITTLFSVFTVMLLLVSCTQDLVNPVEKNNGQPLYNSHGAACDNACIDEDSGDEFAVEYSATVTWGGSNGNSKTFTVKKWNTLTTMEYEFNITSDANNAGNLQYYDEDTGDWVNAGALSHTEPLRISRALDADWSACQVVVEQWRQTGGGEPAVIAEDSYSLIGACGCEDEFSADLDCSGANKVLTVTFTAAEAGDYVIQGGLTSGTTIVSATADAGFERNEGHSSNGGPSNVTRWEGSLEACETVTIEIEYSGGAGVGSWSAKLGEATHGSSEDQGC